MTAEVDRAGGGKAADRLTLTLPADLRLAPGAKARNVVARLNRTRIASSRVRLHGVHQIEVREPREATLALSCSTATPSNSRRPASAARATPPRPTSTSTR